MAIIKALLDTQTILCYFFKRFMVLKTTSRQIHERKSDMRQFIHLMIACAAIGAITSLVTSVQSGIVPAAMLGALAGIHFGKRHLKESREKSKKNFPRSRRPE